MNETDKLRVLIPHWIEHNQEHAQEFLDWVKKIEDNAVIDDVQSATAAMASVNAHLQAALEKLGGALEYDHDHTHHHHD